MYDIAIVGAGVSAVFFSYVLSHRMPGLKILLLEKGNRFNGRICPVESKRTNVCLHCKTCNRLSGFGGLGKSEGKFNYTLDFGGELHRKIGAEETLCAMKTVDKILCAFGGDRVQLYDTTSEQLSAKLHDSLCKNLSTKVRHLGITLSAEIFRELEAQLSIKMEIQSNATITKITREAEQFEICLQNGASFCARKLIIATGQTGGDFLLNLCDDLKIVPQKTRLDLGVRIEIPCDYLSNTLAGGFETKLQFQSEGLTATTYCMNPHGRVVKKYQYGLVMADGQNYLQGDPTDYLNFTVFVPFYFSKASEAREYARKVVKGINRGRERIVCQRYADFMQKIPTSLNRLAQNRIVPTVTCDPGDLWDEVPVQCMDGVLQILNTITGLEHADIPPDTLLYGIDAKFYQPEIPTDAHFQSRVSQLYFLGDCSGITYSLSQAAASGVYLANCIAMQKQAFH